MSQIAILLWVYKYKANTTKGGAAVMRILNGIFAGYWITTFTVFCFTGYADNTTVGGAMLLASVYFLFQTFDKRKGGR